MCFMVLAPLLPRKTIGTLVLAGGALGVMGMAVFGLTHADPRIGLAAIESNRREYIFLLVLEAPVFVLALISRKWVSWLFWVGWGINFVFSVLVLGVIIEFKYFWHW
jgi:hypothetical protein